MTEVLEKDIAFQAHLRQIPIKFAWNRRAKLKKTMKKRVVRSDLQKKIQLQGLPNQPQGSKRRVVAGSR